MKQKVIVVAGPTAVGKSDIAVKLCKLINGAVISADSMQVYKGMNIGSAKVTKEEMDGVDHYLIDVLDPKDEFHVVKFVEMAKEAMGKIWDQGKIPVVAGGTGFYIQALLRDIDFTETGKQDEFRESLENLAREKGPEALHDILKGMDAEAAKAIHPNNIKRVIRAIEFYRETGEHISEHNDEQREKRSPYLFGYFVVNDDRQVLYERINSRVDKMVKAGLTDEVTSLYKKGMTADDISMKGIGYREYFPYFDGAITLDKVIENIKSDTRHFAKKQVTWFKRENDTIWFDRRDYDNDNDHIAQAMADTWVKILSEAEE